MLMKVIVISVLLHVVAGFIAGIITIATNVIKDDAQFEEPPAVEEQEPPKEVKVEIKPPNRQNQPLQKLSLRQVGNIAVASVTVDLPSTGDNFTVSGGIGNVAGGNLLGSARGGLQFGMSKVNVFGLKANAERILFIIDTNRHMVTDAKGGLNSYRVIKEEITSMVGNLGAGTLFNVMLQDRRRTILFKPKLVTAGAEVHQELVKWIAPINSNARNPGLEGIRGAKSPQLKTLPGELVQQSITKFGHPGNETGYITQYALEQGIDAIFFITGYHKGFEQIHRELNAKEEAEWNKKIRGREYQEQLAAHEAEKPEMQKRINQKLAQINKERQANGQPPRVLAERYGLYSQANELGLKWKVGHPGHRPHPPIPGKDIIKYFKKLNEELYGQFDKPVPSVNIVLFLAEDEVFRPNEEDQLKNYTRFYKGKYRIIRGEKAIKQAASAASTEQ